jgi:hypothetical protein
MYSPGGVVFAVVSSPPATKEIGDLGREIDSRQVVAFYKQVRIFVHTMSLQYETRPWQSLNSLLSQNLSETFLFGFLTRQIMS